MNFGFGTQPTTTASTGFSFGLSNPAQNTAVQPTTTQTSQAPQIQSTIQPPASTSNPPITNLSTTTLTTQSASVDSGSQLNYCQLEEYINKWTLELEEEEKLFINQATQVNAWDKILLSNGEKIVELNKSVEKVKADVRA